MIKCHYCDKIAIKKLIWLKDKYGNPAKISVFWCGCDPQNIVKNIYKNPYFVKENVDYIFSNCDFSDVLMEIN